MENFKLNQLEKEVILKSENIELNAIMAIPQNCKGMVVFVHGSGSGRYSSRNNYVARVLQEAQLGTLLLDLLTEEEAQDRRNVFDIALLSDRVLIAKNWLETHAETKKYQIGYFGASTGAGAALVAAAREPKNIAAIVSRGGRPDLAEELLTEITCPILLIVGGDDTIVIDLNLKAFHQLNSTKEMKIIPGATHLFEEPGTLEQVAQLATHWFTEYLK